MTGRYFDHCISDGFVIVWCQRAAGVIVARVAAWLSCGVGVIVACVAAWLLGVSVWWGDSRLCSSMAIGC